MKHSILAFAILALPLFSTAAPAVAPKPLVVKSSGAGFAPPEWQRSETCELYKNRVVITQTQGVANGTTVKLVREVAITLDGSVDTLLANAAAEKEKHEPNMMCDAPATVVSAYVASTKKDIQLYFTGGCGSDRIEREGAASSALRTLVDQFCPTTHDYRQ
jgi:hypothetical protein